MTRRPAKSRVRTEALNPATAALDAMSARGIARAINRQDSTVARAVAEALPAIARAIDAVAQAITRGGRLIYVGAGTSGRLAALDAAESPPTFGTRPGTVQFVIAGGPRALTSATEVSEDSAADGRRDLARRKPGRKDVVVGVAASGRTPYTVAAVQFARRRGAITVAITCNRGTPLQRAAHIAIVAATGPEVLAGSTRMKAGTAQKMVLNMISTGAMARLGYVYGNLMVNVHQKNRKLRERALVALEAATGLARPAAIRALKSAGGNLSVALVMVKRGVSRSEAQRRLRAAHGHVRRAIAGV